MRYRSIATMAVLVAACTPGAAAPGSGAPSPGAPTPVAPVSVAPASVAPGSAAPASVAPASVAPASDPVATQAPEGSPVAGEGTPLLPDPSADSTIGDTITLTDFFEEDQANLTVLQAIQRPASSTSGGPEYAFLVEIEGLADSIHYNGLQFSMFDDENFEYQARDGLQQPELTFGDLAKGRKVRGWLTFVGPDESEYLELQWAAITSGPAFVRVLLP